MADDTPTETYLTLVDGARRPEDVFGDDTTTDDAVALYRRMASVLHPDVSGAGTPEAEAFTKLSTLWAAARAALADGTYGRPAVTITTKSATVRLNGDPAHSGLCVSYAATVGTGMSEQAAWVKLARTPADNDLLAREAKAVRAILAADTTKNPHFFPKDLGSFRHRHDGKQVRANTFARADGFVTIQEIIDRYPTGIDPRDMAWMYRRLLGALGEAHAAGYVHGAVLPHHILIQPTTHDLVLIDWTSSSALGGQQRTPYVVSRYKTWYPATTVAKEPPTESGDVNMAARTMKAVLGHGATTPGRISKWDRGTPPQIRSFFQAADLTRTLPAWEMLDQFTSLIERLWGKRVYREFPWP